MSYNWKVGAALFSVIVGGCVTVSELPFVGAYDKSTDEGRYVDHYDFSGLSYAFDQQAVEADRRTVVMDSMGAIPDPLLVEYAQNVLDRIAVSAPKTTLSSKVHLLASMSPGALTMPSGDIFLNHSIFDYADNEDQLAFVLAHEFSHALLRHDRSDFVEKVRPYVVTAIDVAVGQEGGDETSGKSLKLYGSDLLVRDLLMPVWDRQKENEADRLGIDLMVAAGYNPNEAIKVLQHLKAYEDSFEASFSAERNALEKVVLKNEGEVVEDNKFNIGNLFSKGLNEFQQTFGSRHPDVEERMLNILVYSEREYPEAAYQELNYEKFKLAVANSDEILSKYKVAYDLGRDLASEGPVSNAKFGAIETSANWAVSGNTTDHVYTRRAFAYLRESQGKYDLALKNLELVNSTGGFLPVSLEKDRVSWLEKTGQSDQAYSRIKAVGAFYDWPLAAYPDAIRLSKSKGSKQEGDEMRLNCITKYPQSRDLCQ